MDWYYADAGQQAGPVNDEQLAQLIADGRVTAHTLVWHAGMAQWQPYHQVVAAAADIGGQEGQAVGQGFCSQCGRYFQTDDMIRYQDVWVCAGCKELFFQRVRQGVTDEVLVQRHYAGFWMRFLAWFLDGLILILPNMVINLAVQATRTTSLRPGEIDVATTLLQWAVSLMYEMLFIGRFGATLGKMACGIRVIVSDGSRVGLRQSCGPMVRQDPQRAHAPHRLHYRRLRQREARPARSHLQHEGGVQGSERGMKHRRRLLPVLPEAAAGRSVQHRQPVRLSLVQVGRDGVGLSGPDGATRACTDRAGTDQRRPGELLFPPPPKGP